jgi:anaerobic selenocysteine-containing dehydrogenase
LDIAAIQRLARDYGTMSPAAIRLNYGVQRARGGGNAVRAIACLPALVGAWRHRAGGVLLSNGAHQRFNTIALQRPDLLGQRRPRVLNMSTIGQHLAPDAPHPPVRALVVYNSNPVSVAPDSSRVVAGFARDDLFTVVLEHFRTDTADYADYLLPATTQLEHWDVHATYGHTDVLLNRPAIAPSGEARPNTAIFRELAKRLGFDDPCFDDDDMALCQQALTQADGQEFVPFAELLEHGFATIHSPEALFARGQFPTPSGRCEFFSPRLAAMGQDGLPDHVANYEAPTEDFPLAMISPPARNFLNSSFVNVTSLRAIEVEPVLEIHADDALHEDLGGSAGVAADGLRGLEADETHANGGAEAAEAALNATGDFSELVDHDVCVVGWISAVRTLRTVPAGKGQWAASLASPWS